MGYIAVVNPNAGLLLRWFARLYERGRIPYWLWAAMVVSLVVLAAAITERLPFGMGLSDGTWGILIGIASAFAMYPISLLVMWNVRVELDEAFANGAAVRIHKRILELWHNELERIYLTESKKPAWIWLTTQRYGALSEMANRYRLASTPHDRSLAEMRIEQDMRALGDEFSVYCHFRNGASSTRSR